MPMPEASQATSNTFPKSGNRRTGAWVIKAFNRLKASSAASVHWKVSSLRQSVIGAVTELKFWTNRAIERRQSNEAPNVVDGGRSRPRRNGSHLLRIGGHAKS